MGNCDGCKNEKLDPSNHPCCDCKRCNEHSERDLYSPDNKSCGGCVYLDLEVDEYPCNECVNGMRPNDGVNYYKDLHNPVKNDPVNPDHYKSQCSLECIDVMLIAFDKDAVISFCMCNAFKYMWRFKNKNGEEDLQKAKWYLNKAEDLGPDDYTHDQILRLCATLGRLTNGEKQND